MGHGTAPWRGRSRAGAGAGRLVIRLKDIVEARAIGDHTLHVRFEDGVEGDIEVARLVRFTGVFAPLADPRESAKVGVHPELKTVVWPNGADIDPDVLYTALSGGSLDLGSGTSSLPKSRDPEDVREENFTRAVREARRQRGRS